MERWREMMLVVMAALICLPGVCEGQPTVSNTDLNHDGEVNYQDLLLFQQQWQTSVMPIPRSIELVSVPAGTFPMGCPEGDTECEHDEYPRHDVTLSAFQIGKYEVTN